MYDVISESLNESSRNHNQLKNIFYQDIKMNDLNKFQLNEIEELKESILEIGLLSPLTVKKISKDNYILISGHRRYMALLEAIEDGHGELEEIPCLVIDLGDELKEKISILTANTATREIRDKDTKLMILKVLDEVWDELVSRGETPKGRKREFYARLMGVSPRTMQDIFKLKDEVENQITSTSKMISTNKKLSSLTKYMAKIDLKEILEDCTYEERQSFIGELEDLLGVLNSIKEVI